MNARSSHSSAADTAVMARCSAYESMLVRYRAFWCGAHWNLHDVVVNYTDALAHSTYLRPNVHPLGLLHGLLC